jgi:putative oxidoreductase
MKSFITWMSIVKAPIWVDFLRIVVGAFIVYKGIIFTINFHDFTKDIRSEGWLMVASHMAHAIIFIHLVCGSLLTLGVASRWMSLLNIPILTGAVLFSYQKMTEGKGYLELETTLGVLAVLLLIFYFGSGRLSLDKIERRNKGLD